jgi:hypothetical protein
VIENKWQVSQVYEKKQVHSLALSRPIQIQCSTVPNWGLISGNLAKKFSRQVEWGGCT